MRHRWILALALVSAACTGLKAADAIPEPQEGGVGGPGDIDADTSVESGAADGPTEGGPGGRDGATSDAADASAACDGPCPPEDLATGLPQATTLTLDAQNVYFASEGGSTPIMQCPKSGCGGAPILLGTGYAFGIAVVGGFVMWGDYFSGKVWRCAIGGCGGNPTAIALNQTSIRGVVTDGVKIYWSVGGDIVGCDPASCTPSKVTTPASASTGTIYDMAADQATVLFVDTAAEKVYACTTPSCTTPLLLGTGSHDVSVYSGKAFWGNGTTKLIVECAITGCSNNPQTIGTSFSPSHPASDGSFVYFRDDLSSKIYRCPPAGCAAGPEVFASNQHGQPGGNIAIDGTHVYWTTAGEVRRKLK
jgi:hypothetical protein